MTALRGVRPRKACEAASSAPRYASTSVSRTVTPPATMRQPSKSRAASSTRAAGRSVQFIALQLRRGLLCGRVGSCLSVSMYVRPPSRGATLTALCLVAAAFVALPATPAAAATTITINGTATGRTFDGVGAISGGGGNSRLLIDYPEPQRSQILDYLFRPNYGAAMQILKVEVGGDTNSTSGAEPSHRHTASDLNCGRGYEWWLMEQAKARNPNIRLAALSWGAPGWIGNGNFWSTDMINYLIAWLTCARTNHGLTIDYLGGWNERSFNKQWYIDLNSALDANGFGGVRIVADDTSFAVADQVVSDATFRAAVDVIGSHYVCGYRGPQSNCPSST